MTNSISHAAYDDAMIADILSDVKSVAMIGASANINRPSYL